MAPSPALIIGTVFAKDIIEIAFLRGAFDQIAVQRTQAALIAYLSGLLFYCGLHPLIKAFHAFGDTKTPAKISALMVFLNLVLNLALVRHYGELGLAISTAFCGLISFLWHLLVLNKKRLQIFVKTLYLRRYQLKDYQKFYGNY